MTHRRAEYRSKELPPTNRCLTSNNVDEEPTRIAIIAHLTEEEHHFLGIDSHLIAAIK